jgi:hypothetical protein
MLVLKVLAVLLPIAGDNTLYSMIEPISEPIYPPALYLLPDLPQKAENEDAYLIEQSDTECEEGMFSNEVAKDGNGSGGNTKGCQY